MLKEIIIWTLVIYILSRVLRVIIPIFRVTSAASSHMRQMQDQVRKMQEQMNNNTPPAQAQPKQRVNRNNNDGDYIEYEEVK